MKRFGLIAIVLCLISSSAFAAPLATAARTVIPKDTQQIISVDYRTMKGSTTAMALKDRVLPPDLKHFEEALSGVGINPEKDVDTLTFATFRSDKGGLRMIGIAQGQFSAKKIIQRFTLKKVKPAKYHLASLYPAGAGMQMTFLDDFTMLFADEDAIKDALDAHNGDAETVASNTQITDLINGADNGPVWSVLDQEGTQNMMRSALGDAAQVADYDTVKKRLLGSRYSMNFENGVKFDLDVITADAMTATTLSALVKAGMAYRKMSATGNDKLALDNLSADSDSNKLRVHFKANDNQFQSLLSSDFFTAISR
jgi:hypothetical protein